MLRLKPFLAVLLSLLLLGAQQAAFAHLIGHLGASGGPAAAEVAALDRDDANHGEARTLADACTACVSASAIASAAPFGVPPQLTFVGGVETPPAAAPLARVAAAPLPYLARAPPFLL